MDNILESAQTLLLTYGLRLLAAIAVIVIGRWLAGFISRLVRRAMKRTDIDVSLISFTSSLAYYAILAIAAIAALDRLGIQTTSFVALLGAAGLAVGLALEGSLANFAAGVLILLFRPFKVGDRVEIADTFGQVEEIKIFSTILVTLDNKTVIIPNATVTGDKIINYSKKGLIRLDMVFGIGYDDDVRKAKTVLTELVNSDDRIAKDPAPVVAVSELADSSVNFAVRPYVTIDNYWPVYFDITERVKLRFDAEGISIPFPQRDVHLFPQNGA